MQKITVLITGCSKHSKELIDALKENSDGIQVDTVAVNMDGNKLLRHGTDYQYIAPPITDEGYIPFLKRVCEETHTDIILPYITAELELMAKHKQEFEAMGVHVSVASEDNIRILNDKIKFWQNYQKYMPEQHVCNDLPSLNSALNGLRKRGRKLCCKISGKCGGTGFCIVDPLKATDITLFNRCGVNRYISYKDLEHIIRMGHEVILQEYVPGVDYSVCVLADHGETINMVGYAGYDMEYGAVVNGEIVTNKKAFRVVQRIVKDIGLDGNACFDFMLAGVNRESSHEDLQKAPVKLLECNPRINASIGFCKEAGVNLAYMRCKQLLGTLDEDEARYVIPLEGLHMQKYYESEYFL